MGSILYKSPSIHPHLEKDESSDDAAFPFWLEVDHEIEENIEATETGGKLGSRRNCRLCRKNPFHKNFIPANEFSPSNLNVWKGKAFLNTSDVKVPADHVVFYNYIKTCVLLSVRIESEYVSLERPSENYPLSGKKGQNLTTGRNIGSGSVWKVDEMTEWYVCLSCDRPNGVHIQNKRVKQLGLAPMNFGRENNCPFCFGNGTQGCRCADCEKSGRREARWWRIGIQTARHVIFDTSEARSCCLVFFDDGVEQPLKLTSGKVVVAWDSATTEDYCAFDVYTHDFDLVEKLCDFLCQRYEAQEKINKVSQDGVGQVISPCFLVGYPHGRMCYVTVGEAVDGEGNAGERSRKYRVGSCPGNSGCRVGGAVDSGRFTSVSYAHSGRMPNENGVGTSAGILSFF